MKWDKRFLRIAREVSLWSKDPSTMVGCVIVNDKHQIVATGFNGFPRGCLDDEEIYSDRPRKHLRVVHAEANAIYNAPSLPSLSGCTAYVTAPCCAQCAAALIQAGIRRVVSPEGIRLKPEWSMSVNEGRMMFAEAGVAVAFLEEGSHPCAMTPAGFDPETTLGLR